MSKVVPGPSEICAAWIMPWNSGGRQTTTRYHALDLDGERVGVSVGGDRLVLWFTVCGPTGQRVNYACLTGSSVVSCERRLRAVTAGESNILIKNQIIN